MGGIAAGEKGHLLHVGILAERQLDASAQIAVADDGYADGMVHGGSPLGGWISMGIL